MNFTDSQLLENFITHAPMGVCILNAEDFTIELLNDKFLEFAGKPKSALIGKWYLESFEEARKVHAASMLHVVNSKESLSADAAELNATFTYAPVLNEDHVVTKIAVWVTENNKQVRETNQVFEEKKVAALDQDPNNELTAQKQIEWINNNLNQILNMLPASIVVIRGNDLIVEMINDFNLFYWKKQREDVVGKPFLEILPDLADQPFAGQLRQVMKTGESIDVKESIVLFTEAEGTLRETYVDYTYQPLSDVNGNNNGVLVMSSEITDRVNARKLLEKYADELSISNSKLSIVNNNLAKSEARFRYMIHKAPVAIGVLHGEEFLIESANDKILEVWGKTSAIIGLPLSAALPEIDNQPFLGFLSNVYHTGNPFYANEISAMLEHNSELKEIFFNVVYQPITNLKGKVEDILVVASDVTEQVNSRKHVEKSETYFKQLANLVPSKISNALPNGEVTFFNKQWLDFAGMNFEDLRDFGYHQMMHPDEIQAFQSGLAHAAATGTAHISEMRFKNLQGEYIWHLNIASPVLGEDGRINMWVGSTTNIQPLKEEEQRKNDFIAMVSHELKTPLTSLTGYIQLLNKRAEKGEDLFSKHVFEQSLKQVRNMTSMINGFLNVSRLESSKLHVEKSEFDLLDLWNELATENKLLHPSHEILFDPTETGSIYADRNKFSQVINNLISNAVKYSDDGTAVRVLCQWKSDSLTVSIKDNGIGIPPEELPRLFERYYRVEGQTGSISGFGIGLYLCYEIVKAHQGEIWVESLQGSGSIFHIKIPK
jgi:PAS domain S-box-containing protein